MKQFSLSLILIGLLIGLTGADALGSDPKPASNKTNFMALEDIRPGMKGYGFSVFQGSTPERFEVEILGLLNGMNNPKQSIIIGRLGGPLVARTGVFAGMSGSPIYIDGKLVGAVAYAFPFGKEPIAGIQPIKYMVEIFERNEDPEPSTSTRVSFNTLMSSAEKGLGSLPEVAGAQVGAQAAASSQMIPYIGQTIVPIATPVTFSGIPQSVIDIFSADLRKVGIQAIGGIGGGSSLAPMSAFNETTLAAGTSVSVQLVRGDFTVDAAGTVTYRDGERIYAFGHPFLASGQTSWPMAESSVVTVIPSMNNSFKLSSGGKMVGSISQDRSTGVYGKLGEQPRMVPVRLKVRTSRNKIEDYNFEIVSDPFLTPLLMKIAMFSALTATERQVGNQTIKLTGRISVEGQPDIVLDNSFSLPNGAPFFAVSSVERPLAILFNSGFDTMDLRGVDVEISSSDSRSSGMLSRLWVDKTEVRRGESIEIQAFARNDNGAEFVERIPFEIPADAPAGPLVIIIGDGASINHAERSQPSADFVPKNLGQLIRAINKLKKNNRLYMKAVYTGTGAIVNNEEMPTLPPSVLATLGSQRTSGGYTPLSIATLVERELPPSQFVVSGQQSITVNVVR